MIAGGAGTRSPTGRPAARLQPLRHMSDEREAEDYTALIMSRCAGATEDVHYANNSK